MVVAMSVYGEAARPQTITVQAKSYIAPVNLLDPAQFDADAKSCEQAMSALVTCGTLLGENPQEGSKSSGSFRLWSESLIDIACSGNTISAWTVHPVKGEFGKEFAILATTGDFIKKIAVAPSANGSSPTDKLTFTYRLRGRPNVAGVEVMNRVKTRTCSYIWHEVSGAITCELGKPKVVSSILGSGFPSHKLWVDGKQVAAIQQGPFKKLWQCDSADPTAVK